MNAKSSVLNSLLTPAKLLIAGFTKLKTRFQFSYPVYRVSGTSRKQFVMPDIGFRAVQGHSTRRDIGLGYLIAAKESLNAYLEDLHCLCIN